MASWSFGCLFILGFLAFAVLLISGIWRGKRMLSVVDLSSTSMMLLVVAVGVGILFVLVLSYSLLGPIPLLIFHRIL